MATSGSVRDHGLRAVLARTPWSDRHTFAAFALAYAVATVVGRATVLSGERVSLAWPAAGIGVLWLLHSRHQVLVLCTLTVELAAVLLATEASPALTLIGSAAAVIQTALAVALIRLWIPGTLGAGGLGSIHSIPVLFRGSAAVVVGCLVGAIVGSFGLGLDAGEITWRDGLLWFGRQFGGVMIVGSVGHLTWERVVQPRRMQRQSASRGELLTLWVVSALVYGAVFSMPLPLAFCVIPLSVWCGVRFSTYAAAVHAATFGAIAVALTVVDRGPFSPLNDPAIAALLIQAFVLIALLTALVVGTVRDQREDVMTRLVQAEATAAARAQLLAAMTEAMTEGLVVVDVTGEVVRVNDAARLLLELTPVQGMGDVASYMLMRPDGAPLPFDEHPSRRALVEGDVAPHDVMVPLKDGRRRVLSVRAAALPNGIEATDGPASLLVYRDVTAERAESNRLAEFAEVTAHDLRSPLTTVRGWVSLALHVLSSDGPSDADARELLVKALAGTVRLGELIDDMLDEALAEGAELDLEPLVMAGPDGLVSDLGELLAVPHLVVRDPQGAIVLGDERLVRQLFANLLGNAVKYASPDRPLQVTVDLTVRGRRIAIRVTDNARGIPADEHESVFDRFTRADSARSEVGTGIGLSICHRVVERHGGTISVGAGERGVGTTFSFDLPANIQDPSAGPSVWTG